MYRALASIGNSLSKYVENQCKGCLGVGAGPLNVNS